MPYIDLYASSGAAVKLSSGNNDHTSDKISFKNWTRYYVKFQAVPAGYEHKALIGFAPHFYARGYNSALDVGPGSADHCASAIFYVRLVTSSWDASTITYSTNPSVDSGFFKETTGNTNYLQPNLISCEGEAAGTATFLGRVQDLLSYGLRLEPKYTGELYSDWPALWTATATGGDDYPNLYKPWITLSFADYDAGFIYKSASPQSGYLAKNEAHTFSWATEKRGVSLDEVTLTGYTFEYRTSADGETYGASTTTSTGTDTSITIPANTFTQAYLQWRFSWTDSAGVTQSSNWYTISTAEVTSTATINYPANKILNGSEPTEFSWNHIITTGTAQTAADLQKTDDGGTTWTTLATITGSETTTIIPANTFSAGEWLWRVRTYNTDDVAGEWSEEASFISIAAPLCQGVTATNTPRSTVSWQSSGQIGYQVKIGEYDSGELFGAAVSYRSPIYLDDGDYIVQVRVRNQYGLWSQWETAPITVANTPGADIGLSVTDENGYAQLGWATTEAYDAFAIYRDTTVIAKVKGSTYKDHLAIGTQSYTVRGIYDDSDDYGISNTVNIDLNVECLMIADIKAKEWMKLKLSTASTGERSISIGASSSTYTVSASDYPITETARFKSKSITFRTAFQDPDDAKAFEGFIGRMVIVKTPKKEMFIGALASMSKTENEFFEGYSCRVQHSYIDEEIKL